MATKSFENQIVITNESSIKMIKKELERKDQGSFKLIAKIKRANKETAKKVISNILRQY